MLRDGRTPECRRVNEHFMGGRRRDRARSNGKQSYLSACRVRRVRRCARLATKQAHRVIAHVVAQAFVAASNAGA